MPARKPSASTLNSTDLHAAALLAECRQGLANAKALVPVILGVTGKRTVENTFAPYNDLLIAAGTCTALSSLVSEVHPHEATRDAARVCEQDVSNFLSELSLDHAVYLALAAVDLKTVKDADTKRFATFTLRDYRRAGVDRDDATRERLRTIEAELTRLGQEFSKTISEDVREILISDAARLAGLPSDFIDAHKPDASGNIHVTTDYPDVNPFMTYADDDELRRQLYIAFRSRGDRGPHSNEQRLLEILTLRAEKASILGFANWADYVTEDKMMKSGDNAAAFIERVRKLAAKRAERDYAELLAQLRTTQPGATAVADWQKAWLEHQVKKSTYQVDAGEVRKYFPYDRVLAGLLEITSSIYDLQYVPAGPGSGAVPWHPDVQVFDVNRGATKLGRIYLDMHPREGKYKHAAQFTIKDGVADRQLPEGALVCNFPNPRADDGTNTAALMEHDDVVTMFHEFGHLMHHVLGGNHRWVRQSGVATEWDFVEAPSQMFEEWAWNHETLARFARHVDTGEVIPAALVTKMRRADAFGLGTQTVQQLFYAALSLELHRADPKHLDALAVVRSLQQKFTPFAYVEGTRFHASFGHLVGYSAIYYTYMWSLVIAKDLLTPFASSSFMNEKITHAYRDRILAPGGTKDAAVLVHDFLGRDFDFAAFETYLAT